jgi:hypothetical protein
MSTGAQVYGMFREPPESSVTGLKWQGELKHVTADEAGKIVGIWVMTGHISLQQLQ